MTTRDVGYQHPFFLDQRGERRFDNGLTTTGEPHKDHPTITVTDAPLYQRSVQQSVHPVGHRAGSDKGLLNQFPRGEFMGRVRPSQGGKDIKFPPLEIVQCVSFLRAASRRCAIRPMRLKI